MLHHHAQSVWLRWPIASLASSVVVGFVVGRLGGTIFRTGIRGRASLIPFAIGAGLVAIGAMLPVLLSRPPNLNTGMTCFYVGVTSGTIATFVSFFGVLASQYRSTAWHLYWGKPIFHTLGLLLFWLATAFGAGYGLQGLPKRAVKHTGT